MDAEISENEGVMLTEEELDQLELNYTEREAELNDKIVQSLNVAISMMKENRKLRESLQKRTPEHKELQEVVEHCSINKENLR